jgi:hypothetical protein
MNLAFRPRVVVNTLDYSFSLPMRPPDFPTGGVGGSDTSAAGFPASYGVRDDHMLDVRLRFFEYERPEVEELILEMQRHSTTILFYPDRTIDASQTCYLEAPARGSEWTPTRDSGFPGAMELRVRFRSIVGAWSINYVLDPLES